MATDVNAIAIAYNGRLGLLRSIFGSGEEGEAPAQPDKVEDLPVMTQEAFGAVFGGGKAK